MTLWLWNIPQALLMLCLAPGITGIVRKLKAVLQGRQGASILQPYRDLSKLFGKEVVVPHQASWIFHLAPYIIFAATALAMAILPVIIVKSPLGSAADVIAMVALLALGRFFTALAAMDTGTAFGGLGASREMTLSALAEPAMLMSVFVLSMAYSSTNLPVMIEHTLTQPLALSPSIAFALVAMIFVSIAETGRIPVDNPSTHLELTMIHEAMILEYSGPYLALIEWAAQIKLLLFASLIISLFLPWGMAIEPSIYGLMVSSSVWILKLLIIFVGLVLLETWMAKMRIFRVPEFLGMAFLLAILGMLTHYILEVSV